jgi:hypothetical protein
MKPRKSKKHELRIFGFEEQTWTYDNIWTTKGLVDDQELRPIWKPHNLFCSLFLSVKRSNFWGSHGEPFLMSILGELRRGMDATEPKQSEQFGLGFVLSSSVFQFLISWMKVVQVLGSAGFCQALWSWKFVNTPIIKPGNGNSPGNREV